MTTTTETKTAAPSCPEHGTTAHPDDNTTATPSPTTAAQPDASSAAPTTTPTDTSPSRPGGSNEATGSPEPLLEIATIGRLAHILNNESLSMFLVELWGCGQEPILIGTKYQWSFSTVGSGQHGLGESPALACLHWLTLEAEAFTRLAEELPEAPTE